MNQANQAMQMVQQHGQLVEKAQAELEKNKSEVSMDEANLKVARAQFDADVAKSLANITMQEAALTLSQAKAEAAGMTANVESDREALSLDVKNAITDIQKSAAEYLQQALGTLAQIHQSAQPQVIQAPAAPPRPRVVAIHRKNGALIPQYEDQPAMESAVQ
jgi:paraquat-inducible protein B